MKINSFAPVLPILAALLLSVAGCNAPAKTDEGATTEKATASLNAGEQQAVKAEITGLMNDFYQAVEKLDIERCMTFFENTPDFLAVNPDGTFGDYNSLKKLNADGFSQMAALTTTPKKEDIRVLSDSQVLYTATVSQTARLKTGQTLKFENVASTWIFNKINGAWKATYYHETTSPPTEVKS